MPERFSPRHHPILAEQTWLINKAIHFSEILKRSHDAGLLGFRQIVIEWQPE